MISPNYATLLDAEIHAYLEFNAGFMPSEPSLSNIRKAYLNFCEAIQPDLPEIRFSDGITGGVPTRRYVGKDQQALVVYFHGGGFALGNLESHHAICMEICDQTKLDVLSVDYRLSPEHPFPAHFDDAMAVTNALDGKLILMGDSAGGTLAASVAMRLRRKIHGLMLVYPWLDKPGEHGSFSEHAEAPVLTAQAVMDFETLRLNGQASPASTDYFPLLSDDFNDLPASYVSVAECDPLKDEGVLFNTLQIFSGGDSVLMEEAGLMHGHLHARHHSKRAAEAFQHIVEGLKNLSQWQKP